MDTYADMSTMTESQIPWRRLRHYVTMHPSFVTYVCGHMPHAIELLWVAVVLRVKMQGVWHRDK